MKKVYLILFVCAALFTKAQIITTVAGNGIMGYGGDGGSATSSSFFFPAGLALDTSGNLFIADSQNNVIRRVDGVSGIITTVAGNDTAGFSGDGGHATAAKINQPNGVVVDKLGNLYIVEWGGYRVRKVNYTTGIINTIAGNGTWGFIGDGGQATLAEFAFPSGITLDSIGNLFIADRDNHRIRKVDINTGVITTIVGNGTSGWGGDGGLSTAAQLTSPHNTVFDSYGNLFIADAGSNNIRKVDAITGIISTVAGIGGTLGSYSGDGGTAIAANLYFPTSIAIDIFGNLYINDEGNNRIRKVDTGTGMINTICGTGVSGFGGDGGVCQSAKLNAPYFILFDNSGNLYITDGHNERIRKINSLVGINRFSNLYSQISIYPNPANTTINISSSKNIDEIKITDLLGNEIAPSGFAISPKGERTIDVSAMQNGIYFISITSGKESTTRKLVVSH